jgi:hypothetical protein
VIKLLVLGLAGVAATLAGSFLAMIFGAPQEVRSEKKEPEVEMVKFDVISVPIIRRAKIQGYVVVRIAVLAYSAELKIARPILTAFASEAAFRAIYEEEAFDFTALKPVQIAALAEKITELTNARLLRPFLKQTAIESLNFVSQTEISDVRTR